MQRARRRSDHCQRKAADQAFGHGGQRKTAGQAIRHAGRLEREAQTSANNQAEIAPATPDLSGQALLSKAAESLRLSARAYHRTLRVARTIADLEGAAAVRRVHIAEALSFRRVWAQIQPAPSSMARVS